jgi:hypothetical protein
LGQEAEELTVGVDDDETMCGLSDHQFNGIEEGSS